MEPTIRQLFTTVISFTLVVATIAGAALFGAVAPAAADEHTFEEAPDLTEAADFQVNLPNEGDNYPGSQNEQGGSIEYFASGADAFKQQGAEEGLFLDWVIIQADWIDYSACTTDNTEVFGMDRGNNNEGTKFDDDLLQNMRENNFRNDGLDVIFYNWGDFGGDPPYMAPEDAIVAAQGEGSSGGPCLTLTDEPGWYQIQGFTNGTIADNGPDEQPSEDAEKRGVKLRSNYLYVCECDNEQQAREELGPPPSEQDDTGSDTPTSTPTPEPDDDTPTPTPEPDTATPTPTPEPDTATPTPTPESQQSNDDGSQNSGDDSSDSGGQQTAAGADSGGGQATPTPGAGPGFGPVIAVLALLASALLTHRRR